MGLKRRWYVYCCIQVYRKLKDNSPSGYKKILIICLEYWTVHTKQKLYSFFFLFILGMVWTCTYACVLDFHVLKVEKLKSSRSHCFVKARFQCLPPDNFQAEVVPCGSLAWATAWVLDFLFDLAHIIMGNIRSGKWIQIYFTFSKLSSLIPEIWTATPLGINQQ